MHQQDSENRIRVLLLDDYALFRSSLARLLSSEGDLEVVGDGGVSPSALDVLNESRADVVLLDFDCGAERVGEFISASRQNGYQGRFLMIAGAADVDGAAKALKLGASGIFLKSDVPERLVQAIHLVVTGALWVDQKVVQLLADRCFEQPCRAPRQSRLALEAREQTTLLGILGGLTNRDIADQLGVSESTVKNILQGLFSRTGVRKRSQLVRLALEGSFGVLPEFVTKEAAVPIAHKQSPD